MWKENTIGKKYNGKKNQNSTGAVVPNMFLEEFPTKRWQKKQTVYMHKFIFKQELLCSKKRQMRISRTAHPPLKTSIS